VQAALEMGEASEQSYRRRGQLEREKGRLRAGDWLEGLETEEHADVVARPRERRV
jgi:hypothetical protein